jgi:hypothetical protein
MRIARPHLHVVVVLAWLLAAAAATAQTRRPPPDPELIQIDGSRNPELIPQWSAWGYAFRLLAGGPRQLPTSVLEQASPAEQTLIIRTADDEQRVDAKCQVRLMTILARRGEENAARLDREIRTLALECRRQTLRARDRLLATLTTQAQAALVAFVESTKAGTSVTIPRSQLARFREPE